MASTKSRPTLLRESGDGPRIAKTRGALVYDKAGREYVDFVMGWCVGNFGWGNAVLTKAEKTFDGPDYVYPGHDWDGWEQLARQLVKLAPPGLTRCVRATGGSEAVDLALQAAQLHTGRGKFVALADSYHGNTLATISIAADDQRKKLPNRLRQCSHLKTPLNAEALERLERLLRKDDVAAVVMEPISMNLGVLVPEPEFMRGLSRLCKRHGTLLVLDEVACGFGRTGTLFASERFGMRPDMLTLAKAVTGGYGSMGALLTTAAVGQSLEKEGNFYSTYGWHPRSVGVALTALAFIEANRDKLLAQVNAMSDFFVERLMEMDLEEISVVGLAIGIDFKDEKRAAQVQKKCRDHGLLVAAEGEKMLLLPALNIDRKTAARGLDLLERSL
jgi:acetylornithine/succinyldiaminopimelate/putrescine aminotransferase